MALWGDKDDKTSTGTIAIDAAGAVTGTTTAFTTEARVGDYIVNDADSEHYLITAIADNTNATVVAGVPGATLTAVTAGAAYSLTEKPKYVTTAESATPTHGNPELVFGVDVGEQAAARAAGPRGAHAGWVRRTEGTGARAGRVHVETLVAMSSISGDALDDTEIPDFVIAASIAQDPAGDIADGSPVAFSVTASTTPTGGSLSYQWQVDTGGGFASVVNGTTGGTGTYSGATTDTLSIDDVNALNGYVYRVVVSVTGGADVTSAALTLTVV
jgi:hypothetical protein